jgi:putative pyruvate formate lyase activating enzyme
MACSFCQNYEISQCGNGEAISLETLAGIMLRLGDAGCHNINLVSPSHFVPQIVGAVAIAADEGLSVPLVYNSGGYDAVDTLRLLDGIVDIYMPDAKYADDDIAFALSHAQRYTVHMKAALREMHRQVGDLQVSGAGLAVKGMIIRHLVLPGGLAGTTDVMRFIAGEISAASYVNVMPQYRPAWRAAEKAAANPRFAPLARRITTEEYHHAVRLAREAGLHRGLPGEE